MDLLEIKGLYKEFYKNKVKFAAVDYIDFSIKEGECLGLVGESGCGKSTIASMIAGLLKPDKGQFLYLGEAFTKTSAKHIRKHIQMIFQNPVDSFDPRYSLLSSVKQGLRYVEKCSKKDLERLSKEAIAYVGLKESYYKQPINQLSGGECQRAAIARAIVGNPKLLICDEATSALDVSVQAQIISLLQRLKKEKSMSSLFITHDLTLASVICDRLAVMYRGKIVEYGVTKDIISAPKHPYTELLLQSVLPVKVDPDFKIADYESLREPSVDGCNFYEFCPNACEACKNQHPQLTLVENREVACVAIQK